jgi:hypothetical protein
LWFNFCPYCFDGVGCTAGITLNTDPTVNRFDSTLGPVLISSIVCIFFCFILLMFDLLTGVGGKWTELGWFVECGGSRRV